MIDDEWCCLRCGKKVDAIGRHLEVAEDKALQEKADSEAEEANDEEEYEDDEEKEGDLDEKTRQG